MGQYLDIARRVGGVTPAPIPTLTGVGGCEISEKSEIRGVGIHPSPPDSIVRERITDGVGRTLAVRWVSAIVGDMWVTLDRATALRCGLIRPNGLPVFYLATDDVEFFKAASPEGLERLADFKKVFLSPEIQ